MSSHWMPFATGRQFFPNVDRPSFPSDISQDLMRHPLLGPGYEKSPGV
jgi:hypothetical protein